MDQAERRSSPRVTLDVPIVLGGNNVHLLDVSIGGIRVECDRHLEVNSLADFLLPIPLEYRGLFGERNRISFRVRVKWSSPHPEKPGLYTAGGEVESITEQAKYDLFSYLSLFCGPLYEESRPSRENSGFKDFVPTVHEELIKALGQLAGGIAHDFNNHLMIILGRLQMIRMKGAPPDLDRHAEKAERAALDAAKLIDRLKELSIHPSSVPLGPVQLNAVVETALSNARAWAKGHPKLSEATYSFALALHRPLLCTGIAADLQNALICLLKNAMEAMPEGGQIRISTRPAGHHVVVEIEDDGPGLDPDVRERIFEPFVTTRKGRSRGLGLCIDYGIVRRHGGNITITEGPTGGVRCTLSLEARPTPLANEESPSENSAKGAPA